MVRLPCAIFSCPREKYKLIKNDDLTSYCETSPLMPDSKLQQPKEQKNSESVSNLGLNSHNVTVSASHDYQNKTWNDCRAN